MSRGGFGNHTKRPSPKERIEQAREAREKELRRHRDTVALRETSRKHDEEVRASRIIRDPSRYETALTSIPFWLAGEASALRPSAAYCRLVEICLRAMNDKSREAVLCWPNMNPSLSAAASFIALAESGVTDSAKCAGHDSLSAPLGMRALIFPYARTAHRPLRHIYPDKSYLGRLHTLHQVRTMTPGEDEALADYHKTLARTKSLSGMAKDGLSTPER